MPSQRDVLDAIERARGEWNEERSTMALAAAVIGQWAWDHMYAGRDRSARWYLQIAVTTEALDTSQDGEPVWPEVLRLCEEYMGETAAEPVNVDLGE